MERHRAEQWRWKFIFSNYPKIHIVGRLYLVRIYRYEAKKIAPWIFIVFPKEREQKA